MGRVLAARPPHGGATVAGSSRAPVVVLAIDTLFHDPFPSIQAPLPACVALNDLLRPATTCFLLRQECCHEATRQRFILTADAMGLERVRSRVTDSDLQRRNTAAMRCAGQQTRSVQRSAYRSRKSPRTSDQCRLRPQARARRRTMIGFAAIARARNNRPGLRQCFHAAQALTAAIRGAGTSWTRRGRRVTCASRSARNSRSASAAVACSWVS
jgi:hypothetical protein